MTFRVVSPPARPPFVSWNATSGSFYGYLVDLLPTLLVTAGLSASDYTHTLASNNVANGSLSFLQNDTADLVLFPLTLASKRIPIVDQTVAFNSGGLQILVKLPNSKIGPLAFLNPFESMLWITIVAVVFLVAPATIIITKLTPLGAYGIRRMKRIDVPGEPVRKYATDSESDSLLLDAWMAQIGQAVLPKGRSWAVRAMFLSFGLYGMIVLAAYTANLAASLTSSNVTPSIGSLADLLRYNSTFAVNAGGTDFAFFATCTDPVIQQLQKNVVPVNSLNDGYQLVLNGSLDAYVAENPTLLSFEALPPCQVQVVGEPFGVGSQVMALQKNSTYTAAINKALFQLAENGTLKKLKEKWVEYSATCDLPSTILTQPVPQLDINAFRGLWYMLFLSVGMGLVVVAVERLILYVGKRHPTWHDRVHNWIEWVTGDNSKIFHEPRNPDDSNTSRSSSLGREDIIRPPDPKLFGMQQHRLNRQQSVTHIESTDAVLSSMMAV